MFRRVLQHRAVGLLPLIAGGAVCLFCWVCWAGPGYFPNMRQPSPTSWPSGPPATGPATSQATQPAATTQPVVASPTKFGSPFGYATFNLGNGIDLKLSLIPDGKFLMGDPGHGHPYTTPRHEVLITKPYYMGILLVTEAQYAQVAGMGCCPNWVHGHPVPRPDFSQPMSKWDQVVGFCKTLSQKTGNRVRLPTEAEWERACRAGTDTRWFGGDSYDHLNEYAWSVASLGAAIGTCGASAGFTPWAKRSPVPGVFTTCSRETSRARIGSIPTITPKARGWIPRVPPRRSPWPTTSPGRSGIKSKPRFTYRADRLR